MEYDITTENINESLIFPEDEFSSYTEHDSLMIKRTERILIAVLLAVDTVYNAFMTGYPYIGFTSIPVMVIVVLYIILKGSVLSSVFGLLYQIFILHFIGVNTTGFLEMSAYLIPFASLLYTVINKAPEFRRKDSSELRAYPKRESGITVLAVLSLMTFLTAAAITSSVLSKVYGIETDYGFWDGKVYKNELLDFSLELPQGWIIAGEAESLLFYGEQDIPENQLLFAYSENGNMIVEHLYSRQSVNIAEYVSELAAEYEKLGENGAVYDALETSSVMIGDREYGYILGVYPATEENGTEMHQIILISYKGKNGVCITFTTYNEIAPEKISDILGISSFDGK